MNSSDFWTLGVAIYAAVVATFVAAWDIFKWKTAGPLLTLFAGTGWKTVNYPKFDGKALIYGNVTNRGDRATTITHVSLVQYGPWWPLKRNRAIQNFFVPKPNDSFPLPHKLEPGTTWTAIIVQTDDLVGYIREGRMYLCITHAHPRKMVKQLLTMASPSKEVESE